jgi:hypothetical protein
MYRPDVIFRQLEVRSDSFKTAAKLRPESYLAVIRVVQRVDKDQARFELHARAIAFRSAAQLFFDVFAKVADEQLGRDTAIERRRVSRPKRKGN